MSSIAPDHPASPAPVSSSDGRLPTVRTPYTPAEVVQRLDAAARRGRMPGFRAAEKSGGGALFEMRDVGTPFDSRVVATYQGDGRAEGGELVFRRELRPLIPAVFIAMLVLAIWPGVWLTDSVLRIYFPGTELYTYYWYLPLSIIPTPFAIRTALRRSHASGDEDARKLIEKIAKEVGERGRV